MDERKLDMAVAAFSPTPEGTLDFENGKAKNLDKKEFGKASDYVPDGEWHHIVEQQTVTKGINAGSTVYNSQNTVPISKNLHHEISKYYSIKNKTYPIVSRKIIQMHFLNL
jgi:hypothetical protein